MESAAPASNIRDESVSPPTFGGGSGGGAAGMSTDPLTQLYSIFNLLYGSEYRRVDSPNMLQWGMSMA